MTRQYLFPSKLIFYIFNPHQPHERASSGPDAPMSSRPTNVWAADLPGAPKTRKNCQVGHLSHKLPHLGANLTRTLPILALSLSILAPRWNPRPLEMEPRLASWAILALWGSPRSSKPPLRPEFSRISNHFRPHVGSYFHHVASVPSPT